MISGFHHEVDEKCALLNYYTVGSGNLLLTLWDDQLVWSSGIKNPKEILLSQYRVHKGKSVDSEKSN